MIRLFLGAPVPPSAADGLERAVALARAGAGAAALRWLCRKQWHLTVQFIGATEPGRVPDLQGVLGQLVVDLPAVEASWEALRLFPPRRPRVLAAGLTVGLEDRRRLRRLRRGLADAGFGEREGRWRPHVSVARVRARTVPRLAPVPLSGAFEIDRLVLWRSELDDRGARYVSLAGFPLTRRGCAVAHHRDPRAGD